MKIVIDYIGIDRKQADELVSALSIATEEIAKKFPEIGLPDNIKTQEQEAILW